MSPHFRIQLIHNSNIYKTSLNKHLTKKSTNDLSLLSTKRHYKIICSHEKVVNQYSAKAIGKYMLQVCEG